MNVQDIIKQIPKDNLEIAEVTGEMVILAEGYCLLEIRSPAKVINE